MSSTLCPEPADSASSELSALIARYDGNTPRYTSYPTAPHFREDFGAEDFRRQARRECGQCIAPLSLYLHIPFCRDICYYCACNKVVTRAPEAARRYLDYLQREIRLQAALFSKHRPVTQLHFGGGTPTFLSHAELTELMHTLATHFRLEDSPGREYSIEVDPRTVSDGGLALLKGLGFNRLSFGVQDFNEQVQHAINRVQPHEDVAALVDSARHYAFDSISFDLIYGLPRQTPATLARTLEQVIALRPDRIAFYNYAHLPERFPSQRAIDRLQLPDPAQKLTMLKLIATTLCEAGYLHIGMDHFVRPHDELALAQHRGTLQRNFQGYSTSMAPDLVGLGVSAISSLRHCYSQNTRELEDYYRRLDRGELPVQRGLLLGADDERRRYVISELICNLQLDTRAFERRFGRDFRETFAAEWPRLGRLENDGLIRWQLEGRLLAITAPGRMLLRPICATFDRYTGESAGAPYSRAI